MYTTHTAEYYRGIHYPEYFKTKHWQKLNDTLIDSNRDAKCWICEISYTLLLHHERYDNLFHERLNRDVFCLCFTCHTQLHFYRFLFVFNRKTSLSYVSLKRRRLWMKLKYVIRKRNISSSIWYTFRYIFVL
jgi:hypothetical protein